MGYKKAASLRQTGHMPLWKHAKNKISSKKRYNFGLPTKKYETINVTYKKYTSFYAK